MSSSRYQQIPYRRASKSGLCLPSVSLGLWHNFGGDSVVVGSAIAESRRLICHAFDKGITYFDLANNYGPPPGSAEENFGAVLKQDLAAHRDELIIASKAGYEMWEGPYGNGGSRKYIIASADQSLRRMGLSYVDIFYSHRYDPETPLEETMSALHTLVIQGKALYVGISNYPLDAAIRAADILCDLGSPLVISQPKLNLLHRQNQQDIDMLYKQAGISSAIYSPLAQGILTDRYREGVPSNSRAAGDSQFLNAAMVEAENVRVSQLHQIADQRGQSLQQMAISWLLEKQEIATVIIGASREQHIDDAVAASNQTVFDSEQLARIDRICEINKTEK